MEDTGKIYYVPELRISPAIYPLETEGPFRLTMDAFQAMKFNSKDDCEKWCKANPHRGFSAVEHVFYEESEGE